MRERLLETLRLKQVQRAGWVRAGVDRPESVADHSWGVAWLVLALCPAHLDRGRALAIAVLHDLAEVRVGDITPHDDVRTEEKRRREREAFRELTVPLPHAAELRQLLDEYERGSTPEGRLVRACDKLEMALQAQLYQADQGLDLAEFVASALVRLDDPDLRGLLGE